MASRSAIINVMARAAEKAARAADSRLRRGRTAPGFHARGRPISSRPRIPRPNRSSRPNCRRRGPTSASCSRKAALHRQGRQHRWIVDPLDGTTNFLHGMPFWAISIALEQDGEIVAGIVYEPVAGRDVLGREGRGRLDQRPAASRVRPPEAGRVGVRHRPALRDAATMPTTCPEFSPSWRKPPGSAASAPRRSIWPMSRPAVSTATGSQVQPWDVAAGLIIVRRPAVRHESARADPRAGETSWRRIRTCIRSCGRRWWRE